MLGEDNCSHPSAVYSLGGWGTSRVSKGRTWDQLRGLWGKASVRAQGSWKQVPGGTDCAQQALCWGSSGACYTALQPCRTWPAQCLPWRQQLCDFRDCCIVADPPQPPQAHTEGNTGAMVSTAMWMDRPGSRGCSKHDTLQNEATKAAFSYTKYSFLLLAIMFVPL